MPVAFERAPTLDSKVPESPDHARARARIHLAGPLRAITLLGDDVLPRSRKARAAVAMCCLSPGQAVTRSELAATLWDRVAAYQQRASLRQVVLELTPTMGPDGHGILILGRNAISVAPNAVWVDTVAIMNLASEGAQRTSADLLALCHGQLLEGLDGISKSFDRWLVAQRNRYRLAIQTVLQLEHDRSLASDVQPAERIEIARSLLQVDPTLEGSSRVLIATLAEVGEHSAAMREYARLEAALNDQLAMKPSPETIELAGRIRREAAKDGKRTNRIAATTGGGRAGCDRKRIRLRLAVQPFHTVGKLSEAFLPIVVAHDIAAALASFRWFDVIMPAAPPGEPETPLARLDKRRAPALKTDYALTGTLTQTQEHIRVAVQVLDVRSVPRPVWSDVLTLAIDDVAEFSDRITSRIVARVDPLILFIEGTSSRKRNRTPSSATAMVTSAIALLHTNRRPEVQEAGRLLEAALKIDPDNAMAASWYAFWHMEQFGQGWSTDLGETVRKIRELALRAVQCDPGNAEAACIYGHFCSFYERDFDRALRFFDKALNLNPNLAIAWLLSAPTYCYIGKPDEALRRLHRYRDLVPHDPYSSVFETIFMIPHLLLRRFADVASIGRHAVEAKPNFINGYKPLISALGHLGLKAEAKGYLDKLLSLEPEFSIEQFLASYPLCRDRDRRLYASGLRKAGVRERA